jgi:hypothetical protein
VLIIVFLRRLVAQAYLTWVNNYVFALVATRDRDSVGGIVSDRDSIFKASIPAFPFCSIDPLFARGCHAAFTYSVGSFHTALDGSSD